MRYTVFFLLLPLASCLLPLASYLPLLGGVRGGFLLPLTYCLLPLACSLKTINVYLISIKNAISLSYICNQSGLPE
ncbi:MAG: hypothetical protein F6J90_13980 [Moorea sp. SIOASIH]|uniref:hypothetical protein n=1 Tax=Moorena sp. SIOASIH TaxID=2607817 RepID=UPI0013BC7C0B|nr:hypothetical protein [Moorena sp. SIOASIH]NEO37370.1 hypothetical protein [Moorena sp. SIOASIH]